LGVLVAAGVEGRAAGGAVADTKFMSLSSVKWGEEYASGWNRQLPRPVGVVTGFLLLPVRGGCIVYFASLGEFV
jgi:hypothetical protein